MGGNCPERFDLEFLKFVWKFNKNNRNNYYKLLEEAKGKKIIILRNRRETAKFIKEYSEIREGEK